MINLKNIISVIIIITISLFLSACYGVMMPFSATLKIKNSSGHPIPKLQISYKESTEQEEWVKIGETDLLGEFSFSSTMYNQQEYNFLIKDIDGDENLGTFVDKVVTLEDKLEEIILED